MIQFGLVSGYGPGFSDDGGAGQPALNVPEISRDLIAQGKTMTMTNRLGACALACTLGLVALAIGFSTRGVAADDSAESKALKAFQGTWVTSENNDLDAKWVFKGEIVEITVNGMDYKGKVKLDDKAMPHPTLDIDLTEGPEDAKGKTAKGVYKLEGDKLVISVSHPGHDRPKEFEPVPDEVYLFELKKKS
jgi:uncharacterized protein (TIGR03067 family)